MWKDFKIGIYEKISKEEKSIPGLMHRTFPNPLSQEEEDYLFDKADPMDDGCVSKRSKLKIAWFTSTK